MIKLQAAMALGLLLAYIGGILLCLVFPAMTITFSILNISKKRKTNPALKFKDYVLSILRALLFSVLIIISVALVILLLLYLCADLSIS